MVRTPEESQTKPQPGAGLVVKTLPLGKVVSSLCATVIVAGCLDLLGWIFHVAVLTSFIPHYATMKPNTALCLGLLAAATLLLRAPAHPRSRRAFAAGWIAGLSMVLSGATLLEYVTRTSTGIDALMIRVPADRFGEPIGRMSLGTAACLMLLSLSIVVIDRAKRLSTGCLVTVHMFAVSTLVGFLFSAGPLYGVPWLSSMAVHTSLCVFALSVAVLVSRPEREPVASLLRQTFSGGAPQWILIGITVLPVLLALPAVMAMRRGAVDVGFTMALVVVVLIGLQTCMLWRDIRALHQAQVRRRKVEVELARSQRFAVVGRLTATISHEVTNSLDIARNLVFLIDGSVSLTEAKSFASLAGGQLEAISQITSQTSKFYEQEPELGGTELRDPERGALARGKDDSDNE